MKLTDTAVRKSKPEAKPYKMADGGGMYLEVMPNGSKYWRLKYRYEGKEKRLAFGVYPDITLADARQQRDDARKLLAHEIDPSAQKKAVKAAKGERDNAAKNLAVSSFKRWDSIRDGGAGANCRADMITSKSFWLDRHHLGGSLGVTLLV